MSRFFYAGSMDDFVSRETAASMSGLEAMQGILDGKYPAPPISRLLNFRLHEISDGKVLFRGEPTFDTLNPMGTVHGGWYGAILDSAMACSVMTKLPRGSAYTTLEYKINIVRAIPLGTVVEASGEVSHGGRSTGVAEGKLIGVEDGRLYATGSTTCMIMKIQG